MRCRLIQCREGTDKPINQIHARLAIVCCTFRCVNFRGGMRIRAPFSGGCPSPSYDADDATGEIPQQRADGCHRRRHRRRINLELVPSAEPIGPVDLCGHGILSAFSPWLTRGALLILYVTPAGGSLRRRRRSDSIYCPMNCLELVALPRNARRRGG